MKQKKTLIEFLDAENLNNCISQLCFDYDNIIYFYFSAEMTAAEKSGKIDALKNYNSEKINVEMIFREIENNNPEAVYDALVKLINDEESFDIDLTGGSEKFGYIVGKLMSDKKYTNVRVHSFDIINGMISQVYPECKTDEIVIKRKMKINDLIQLQASDISNEFYGVRKYRPKIEQNNYETNIYKIWNVVKDYPKEWNSFCGLFNEIKKIDINNSSLNENDVLKIFGKTERNTIYKKILKELDLCGIINIKVLNGNFVIYSINLPNEQKDLLDKGGNIFEMYVYSVAKSIKKFDDWCVGVQLDWDGIFENKREEVTNEVDVILSNGYFPIFISCKNTEIVNSCVYEIDTVTRYYGGKFAKPIIVSTVKASQTIKNRATESGIILIDNVASMSRENFRKKLEMLT